MTHTDQAFGRPIVGGDRRPLVLVLDALAGPSWWVQWVVFGWAIGVAAHALAVFGRASKFVTEWEDRKIKQLMAEQR